MLVYQRVTFLDELPKWSISGASQSMNANWEFQHVSTSNVGDPLNPGSGVLQYLARPSTRLGQFDCDDHSAALPCKLLEPWWNMGTASTVQVGYYGIYIWSLCELEIRHMFESLDRRHRYPGITIGKATTSPNGHVLGLVNYCAKLLYHGCLLMSLVNMWWTSVTGWYCSTVVAHKTGRFGHLL